MGCVRCWTTARGDVQLTMSHPKQGLSESCCWRETSFSSEGPSVSPPLEILVKASSPAPSILCVVPGFPAPSRCCLDSGTSVDPRPWCVAEAMMSSPALRETRLRLAYRIPVSAGLVAPLGTPLAGSKPAIPHVFFLGTGEWVGQLCQC